jgi:2-oxoglutarate dehydrogenase E1 component
MNDIASISNRPNLDFVEQLYRDYLKDPDSIPPDWCELFEQLQNGQGFGAAGNGRLRSPAPNAAAPRPTPSRNRSPAEIAALQDRVDQLVRAYRVRGHMVAKLDPLDRARTPQVELDPEHYGFTDEDMSREFSSRTIAGGDVRTLREILDRLRETYCRSIGVQFMHIDELGIRHWLQDRMEGTGNRIDLSRSEQIRILTLLTEAVVFEEFVQKKYVGAKTFSLEGCESLIPLLAMAIELAAEQGVDAVVMGMAHRGRLNVLANIMGKRPQEIFREFEDADPQLHTHGGDVKYHLGYSSTWEAANGRNVELSLCFNPSHLEYVNPVVVGRARAQQDRMGDSDRKRVMALLIHGDASFAGEGIVQETLNLSQLAGYTVSGTLHVIVNNQIGFTTPPESGRSSIYASAVAKMLQSPIFHVNGEDPEAVAQVVHLAMDFRREFRRDVFIDMYGYRRHGHNEGDEPSFTQPLLYRAIRERKPVRDAYFENLARFEGITPNEADGIVEMCQRELERGLSVARSDEYAPPERELEGVWSGYIGGPEPEASDPPTAVDRTRLAKLLKLLTRVPAGFHLHKKLERFMQSRVEMSQGIWPIEWSAAEALAFATLATEGIPTRFSGQDSARGTFSQRHAVLHDVEDGHTYMPLQHLAANQAPVEIYDSPLSEAGVMGFEYGYSLDQPDTLTAWEAQFGDFWNAAQVIVDQFIASAEDKWRLLSGLTLFLPHGFEGQGPEHSSARLERFLLLAAEDNIQVTYPTTPAQLFHLLRRQAIRSWRKPLVVMTPKSLLRSPKVASNLDELDSGSFQRIIPDGLPDSDAVRRVLLCSGKIYYELLERRESLGREDVAIVRIEQLYPLPSSLLQNTFAPYRDGTSAFWVQEEPENMGAWRYVRARFGNTMLGRLPLYGVTRPESASPATGSASSHRLEQEHLIDRAFGDSGTRP